MSVSVSTIGIYLIMNIQKAYFVSGESSLFPFHIGSSILAHTPYFSGTFQGHLGVGVVGLTLSLISSWHLDFFLADGMLKSAGV